MNNRLEKITVILLAMILFVVVFNAFQLSQFKDGGIKTPIKSSPIPSSPIADTNPKSDIAASGIDVIPKGVPAIYGGELGVGYDDVSSADQKKADSTINKLGALDRQIVLSGKDKERYISIASQISCEYCCGVDSIIFKDGSAACGCAHSFAMRGIAKYLIKNHATEFTDDEILEELGKWKTLFFPANIAKKASVLKGKGIELNYINLASNKYRGIEV